MRKGTKYGAQGLARAFALEVAKRSGTKLYPVDEYGPRVRNAVEAREHGWMPQARATVTFEDSSIDLISIVGDWKQPESDYYIECYSSYMVGVFPK